MAEATPNQQHVGSEAAVTETLLPPESFLASANSLFPRPKETWRQRYLHGWRGGILIGALSTTFVFLFNLIVTVVAIARRRGPYSNRTILFDGDCAQANRLSIAAHLIINAWGTIVLGASSYCMQCLTAPTRREVDIAHSRRKWLDIGVLSIRNLRSIDFKRVILWVLLACSSLPLHLLLVVLRAPKLIVLMRHKVTTPPFSRQSQRMIIGSFIRPLIPATMRRAHLE
jgi:hypothetical protein